MVQKFFNEWGALPPKWRMAIRTATAAVGGVLVAGYMEGTIKDWDSLKGAVIAVTLKLILGLFTPEEPFVGFNKPEVVAVPKPPAVDENVVN
jgi:hypothetical protein